jgi:hypothetical protein
VLQAGIAGEDGWAAQVRGGLLDNNAIGLELLVRHVAPRGSSLTDAKGNPGTAIMRSVASTCRYSMLTTWNAML